MLPNLLILCCSFLLPLLFSSISVCVRSRSSSIRLCATLWTIACQAPLSMEFSRQEYWSGLPCPFSGDLPDAGIKLVTLMSPALAGRFFTIGIFSNELALLIRWPKYWSFSIRHSNEYSELISFRIDWFDLLAVQWTLKNFLQYHFFSAQLSLWTNPHFHI